MSNTADKPDFIKLEEEKFGSMADNATWSDGCDHVWNTYVVPLQRNNDNQAITINEFQSGLGEFVNAPIRKVAFFSEAAKYLKAENKSLREEIEKLKDLKSD